MAVTPVRILSPSMQVTCPTVTPGTSVMALGFPVSNIQIVNPCSLRVFFWADASVLPAARAMAIAAIAKFFSVIGIKINIYTNIVYTFVVCKF